MEGLFMQVTLEQIEIVKEKANVTYIEAKEALERNQGDILTTLIELEQRGKVNLNKSCGSTHTSHQVKDKIKGAIDKGNQYRLKIVKDDETVLNVNGNVAILIGILGTPVAVAGIIGAWLTNHKVQIIKPNGENLKIF